VAVVALEAARTVARPPEAGQSGHTGLVVTIGTLSPALLLAVELAAGGETAGVLDFAQAPGDEDGAQAGLGQGEGRLRQMLQFCLLYTSPSPRDRTRSRMPSSA